MHTCVLQFPNMAASPQLSDSMSMIDLNLDKIEMDGQAEMT